MNIRMASRVTLALFLAYLLPSTLYGWPADPPPSLHIQAIPATGPYVIGEPMPVTIEVTNTHARAQVPFTWQFAGDRTSGVNIELTHMNSGQQLQFTGHGLSSCSEGWIGPGAIGFNYIDLARAFKIEEPGRYSVRVRYWEHMEEIILDADGKEVGSKLHKGMEIQSEPMEIVVELPDPETIGKIEALFRSGKDEDIEQALRLMATVRPAIYRKGVPALWTVIRTRQGAVKDDALKVFLGKIDLLRHSFQGDMDIDGKVLSDDELFSELEYASTSRDASVRVAAAQAISTMQTLWRRRQAMNSFIAQKTSKWFDGETSPDCRAALVRYLPVPKSERLISIVQQDSAPQVRVAAIQRLIELDPHRFLESADSFAQLSGEVTIEGQTLSLGAFVAAEKSRIERYLRPKGDSIEEPRDAPPR